MLNPQLLRVIHNCKYWNCQCKKEEKDKLLLLMSDKKFILFCPQAGQAFTFWLQPQKVNKKGRRCR